jgi:hypothetical protein
VSFDLRGLPFFDGHLRRRMKAHGLRAFAWTTSTNADDGDAVEKLVPYVTDPDIDAVLVGFKSPFDL